MEVLVCLSCRLRSIEEQLRRHDHALMFRDVPRPMSFSPISPKPPPQVKSISRRLTSPPLTKSVFPMPASHPVPDAPSVPRARPSTMHGFDSSTWPASMRRVHQACVPLMITPLPTSFRLDLITGRVCSSRIDVTEGSISNSVNCCCEALSSAQRREPSPWSLDWVTS